MEEDIFTTYLNGTSLQVVISCGRVEREKRECDERGRRGGVEGQGVGRRGWWRGVEMGGE